MSAQITIEITKYTPEDNELSFHFKSDDKSLDTLIAYDSRTSIVVNLANIRKEFKMIIRVMKNGVMQGVCEYLISQLTFLKREEKLNKTIVIYDLLRKNNIGKLFLKLSINYNDHTLNSLNNNNNFNVKYNKDQLVKEYVRSSSATPIDSKNYCNSKYYNTNANSNQIKHLDIKAVNQHASATKNIKNIINSVNSNFSTNFSKFNKTGKNSISNNLGTNYYTTNKSQDSIKIDEPEKEEIEHSRIDTLFDEDKLSNIDDFARNINKFVELFKEKFLFSSDDCNIKLDEISKESCKNILEKLFELQEIYYDDINKSNHVYQEFKKFLINYSENYRNLMKKTNRLNEAFESLNLKTEFANFINREENRNKNKMIDINRNEIKIYKNIFGLEYQISDVLKYKEELEKKKDERQKKSMIKALELIAKNPDKFEKLEESKKELFISMAAKFCIDIKSRYEIEEKSEKSEYKAENQVLNNSLCEKESLNEESKICVSDKKESKIENVPFLYEKETSEEKYSLGYRDPIKVNDTNINNINNSNSQNVNQNMPTVNSLCINKLNLSVIKEEKEILSNVSLKNNFSEDFKRTTDEKNNAGNKINNFIDSENNIIADYKNINEKNGNYDNNNPSNTPIKEDFNKNTAIQNFSENSSNGKDKLSNISNGIQHKKRLTIVDSKIHDSTDELLDETLKASYNKKKMSYIPMKRLSENNYEFGTQKIEIIVDSEMIRVKTGGGYILLDKYIDIYGAQEENILIQSCRNKDKGNSITTGLINKNKRKNLKK